MEHVIYEKCILGKLSQGGGLTGFCVRGPSAPHFCAWGILVEYFLKNIVKMNFIIMRNDINSPSFLLELAISRMHLLSSPILKIGRYKMPNSRFCLDLMVLVIRI